jgi:hypothetical protein
MLHMHAFQAKKGQQQLALTPPQQQLEWQVLPQQR